MRLHWPKPRSLNLLCFFTSYSISRCLKSLDPSQHLSERSPLNLRSPFNLKDGVTRQPNNHLRHFAPRHWPPRSLNRLLKGQHSSNRVSGYSGSCSTGPNMNTSRMRAQAVSLGHVDRGPVTWLASVWITTLTAPLLLAVC